MQKQNKTVAKWLTLTIIACLISALLGSVKNETTVKADTIPTPRPSATLAIYHAEASPSALPIQDPIKAEIKSVFGQNYSRAMKLLQGSACHENIKLDPKAINDNTTWGGVGQDNGLWQINNIYHPEVSLSCAFDYKCATKEAYRIFKGDHYSFKQWTCGKYYGI